MVEPDPGGSLMGHVKSLKSLWYFGSYVVVVTYTTGSVMETLRGRVTATVGGSGTYM